MISQRGRADVQNHVAVLAVGPFVEGEEQIGGGPDVVDADCLEHPLGRPARLSKRPNRGGVHLSGDEALGEDARVGDRALDFSSRQASRQGPGIEEVPPHPAEPDRDPEGLQALVNVHSVWGPASLRSISVTFWSLRTGRSYPLNRAGRTT